MEAVFTLIFLALIAYGVFVLIRAIVRGASRSGTDAYRTVRGQGSLSDNLAEAYRGFPPTEVRVVQRTEQRDDGYSENLFVVEARGHFPNAGTAAEVAVAVSIMDITESGNPMPVHSIIDNFQESSTRAFQYQRSYGIVQPDWGFTSWTPIGFAVRDTIWPPKSGLRKLAFVTRWLSPENVSAVKHGYLPSSLYGKRLLFWASNNEIPFQFSHRGYIEFEEDSERSQVLAVKLAIDIAMTDGTLHESEGNVIKKWTEKYVGDYEGLKREEIKEQINSAMKSAHAEISSGIFDRESVIEELSNVGGKPDHYEAVELLVEVMAADEVAHESELIAINEIGTKLGIDPDELQRLKDTGLLDQSNIEIEAANVEHILVMEEGWETERICAHLTDQFVLWNSRIQALTDESERKQAQRRLDLIGQAREKYC